MLPFFIGTYTSGSSKGIYRCLLDPSNGSLSQLEWVAEVDNPSFLTLHPHLDILYTCSEVRKEGRREHSQVLAFKIDGSGKLEAMGGQSSGGSGPCYVSTDRTGKVALVANYGSGCIASLPIAADGSLGPIASHVQHAGKSINPSRQEGPHAHCIMTDPSNRYACAVDLGLDQVLVYELDVNNARMTAKPAGNLHAKPGNGPRHLAFHPGGELAFVIHEIGCELSACGWDAHNGAFSELATIPTLPEGYHQSDSSTAEVLVHPNGRFIYGSNRGHDSIALFTFDAHANKLTLHSHTPSGGKTPRNFQIDPTGEYLLAENQDSDSIIVMKIDQASGALQRVGPPLEVGSPCCIKFHSKGR